MCLNHPCSDPSVGPRSVHLPQANWVIILHFVIRGTFFLSMEPTLLTADTSISPFVIQWILLTPDSRTTPGRAAVNICKRRARLGSLCLSSLPHAERGKIQADEMWEGGAVFETESKHYVRAVVVSLPTTATFNTGPHVLVPPNRKIVFVATYSYSFAIIHHNVNICVFWWSWMIYVKGLFDTRRGCNPWLRTTAWGDSVPGKQKTTLRKDAQAWGKATGAGQMHCATGFKSRSVYNEIDMVTNPATWLGQRAHKWVYSLHTGLTEYLTTSSTPWT